MAQWLKATNNRDLVMLEYTSAVAASWPAFIINDHLYMHICFYVMNNTALCNICETITFDAIESSKATGFPHYKSFTLLENSAQSCPLCSLIWEGIQQQRNWTPTEEHSWDKSSALIKLLIQRSGPQPQPHFVDSLQPGPPIALRIEWFNNKLSRTKAFAELDISEDYGFPSWSAITKRLSPRSSSNSSFAIVEDWVETCSHTHGCCYATTGFIPKRLIDVGPEGGSEDPRLVIIDPTSPSILDQRYVALSYCWGTSVNFTTTSATLKERQDRILVNGVSLDGQLVPQTIKDAITITRRLRVRYLWIDALCIIQGSDEQAAVDWQTQSGMMGEIYGNSFVTIAVAKAPDVHEGIFHSRKLVECVPIPKDFRCVKQFYISASPRTQNFRDSIFHEPLYKRAWALQERILSPRVVTYGTNEITWQCRFCIKTESGSLPPETTRSLTAFNKTTMGVTWPRIVTQYSRFAAARTTDKLPALSGLVKTLQSDASCIYLAGLWKHTICNDLLWRAEKFGFLQRPPAYRAPSWSWASLDGVLNNIPRESEDFARLEDYHIAPSGLDPNGEVADAWIIMNAPFARLPEFRTNTSAAGEIQKLDIFDNKGVIVGGAFLDTFDRAPLQHSWTPTKGLWIKGRATEAFGLQIKQNAGVIVACSAETEDTYERLGMFMLNYHGERMFSGVAEQTIKMI